MSDGMSDSLALERMAARVHAAATELADAIQEVEEGHRGLTLLAVDTANATLLIHNLRLEKIK
jgi:hypothetical protein